jgi:hypothetical protein
MNLRRPIWLRYRRKKPTAAKRSEATKGTIGSEAPHWRKVATGFHAGQTRSVCPAIMLKHNYHDPIQSKSDRDLVGVGFKSDCGCLGWPQSAAPGLFFAGR